MKLRKPQIKLQNDPNYKHLYKSGHLDGPDGPVHYWVSEEEMGRKLPPYSLHSNECPCQQK